MEIKLTHIDNYHSKIENLNKIVVLDLNYNDLDKFHSQSVKQQNKNADEKRRRAQQKEREKVSIHLSVIVDECLYFDNK